MKALRKLISAGLIFICPSKYVYWAINMLGHRVSRGASIGFSWLWCDFIGLDEGARVGHFNYLQVPRLVLRRNASIGQMNVLKGPVDVRLKQRAAIGNRNRVLRGRRGVTAGGAQLVLGELTKITADHRIDCTETVRFGAFSILAGAASQVWTHGYIHELVGPGRYRIDGRVEVEDNVYIGSACIISMGVRIGRGIIVGAGTTVSKSLTETGMYASAPIRCIPRPPPPDARAGLTKLPDGLVGETVYVKQRP